MLDATYPPARMRFSFESRCRIVQLILEGESPAAAAGASGASRATGYRLWRRYRDGGWEALRDRPSTPKRQPRRLSVECEAGLPKPEREPVVRYERERPGELLHVDTKRLNRFWQVGKRILGDGKKRSPGAGWQFLHVAIDDHTRLAYAEVLPAEDGKICAAFLTRALAW